MTPLLSVVVPVYDNWWMTARALRVLAELRASSVPFETIVVDNASRDETPHEISAFAWVRYARMERNRNFAGACNAGARLARAPLVLFLNNDAYPLGDALTPLVRAFDRDDVSVAGGALFFEDGATQCSGFVVLPNAHWHYSCRNLPGTLDAVARSRDAVGVSGAAMAVRNDWFLAGGGFDELYVNGFEDVDVCMRARAEGRAIAYVADAAFAHYEGASAGRFDREAENERRFYRRWSSAFAGIPRTARGEVGGIVVRTARDESPMSAAALDDLESGLRSFGHPTARGATKLHQRLDRRFRTSATLDWFAEGPPQTGVCVDRRPGQPATMRARGAVDLEVPWLPCAGAERVADLPVRASLDPNCSTLAVAGFASLDAGGKTEMVSALGELTARHPTLQLVDLAGAGEMAGYFGDRVRVLDLLARESRKVEVACVLQTGLTDQSAFGNVLLAQADFATIVPAESEIAALFAADVVATAGHGDLAERVTRFLTDMEARTRYGRWAGADARRRFSPRRCAVRVVDLLCAARFGLERPGTARTNTPLA